MTASQAKLFSDIETPLPEWLPDETLFSLVSRTHVLSGSATPIRTSQVLFGRARRGAQHDFPGYLSYFESATRGVLGRASEIARKNSLLSFYRCFLSDGEEAEFAREMSEGDVAHLKFRLGLLTSRFRANHPLKACPECLKVDRIEYGWQYWHLGHQFPGVWICEKHSICLQECLLKSTGVERFGWVLPNESNLRTAIHLKLDANEHCTERAIRFAALIREVVAGSHQCRFDRNIAYLAYRRRLASMGFERGGRLLWGPLSAEFRAHLRELRLLPEFSSLEDSDPATRAYLSRLLRLPRARAHPLWHLLLVSWLFDDGSDFFRVLNADCGAPGLEEGAPEALGSVRAPDERRTRLVSRILDHGDSLRAASSAAGVDISTGMAWAAEEGISPKRRSKVLKADIRVRLESELRRGGDKTDLASQFGVSIQTITRTLLTTPGLHQQWTDARHEKRRGRYRRLWRLLCKRYPGAGVKLIRANAPAAYAWLYRNDRDWLNGNKPERVERTNNGLPDSVWSKRDDILSSKILMAANGLIQQGEAKRLFLWQLYQAVPGLRPMLRRLERLPRTRSAIELVLGWRCGSSVQPELFT